MHNLVVLMTPRSSEAGSSPHREIVRLSSHHLALAEILWWEGGRCNKKAVKTCSDRLTQIYRRDKLLRETQKFVHLPEVSQTRQEGLIGKTLKSTIEVPVPIRFTLFYHPSGSYNLWCRPRRGRTSWQTKRIERVRQITRESMTG